MQLDLMTRFALRIERFFRERRIEIDGFKAKNLINFLYQEFTKQNRFKGENKSFIITTKFIRDGIANFLKISPEDTSELMHSKSVRSRRLSANYETVVHHPAVKGNIISRVGRRHNPKMKVTQPDGTPLTPKRKQRTADKTDTLHVSFSPLAPCKTLKPRQQARASDGSLFVKNMETSDGVAVWVQRTPDKQDVFPSPDRLQLHQTRRAPKPKRLFSDSKTNKAETFRFSLTKEDILDRLDVPRTMSQKAVMDNTSAFEYLQIIGALIKEKQSGRDFHWAHRQAWSLKGEQTKENLDPMTAGANYDTLFKVEAPIKKMLLEDGVEQINVIGSVVFDEVPGIPLKITYRISWRPREFIEVVIDPRSHRIPTVDEHEMASAVFDMMV